MSKPIVAIVPYRNPLESVRHAVDSSGGLNQLKPKDRVFIKPNIVFWSVHGPFPKWGVITTSRVVEDVVVLLKERGIDDITIGEGMVIRPTDHEKPAHAFETLGYNRLRRRYGVKIANIMERPFEEVDLGDDVRLNFNSDILASDFVVNLPVLKTHVQTVVSLGIKNLKGTIDMRSRKRCHNADPVRDLHFWVSRLADKMPPMFTLIDGIYSNERGPGPDGRIRRTNLLIASSDVLSADLVGARVLGHTPDAVPHLVLAAQKRGRPLDLSDIELSGEEVDNVAFRHEFDYAYGQADDGSWLPAPPFAAGHQRRFLPKIRHHHVHLLFACQWTGPGSPPFGLEGKSLGQGGSSHRQKNAADPRNEQNHTDRPVHVQGPQEKSCHQGDDSRERLSARTGRYPKSASSGRYRRRRPPVSGSRKNTGTIDAKI